MKKLYFFLLLALSATNSFAQRNVDLQLIHPFLSDTIKVKNPNTTDTTFVVWGFVNNGPDAIAATDTIIVALGNIQNAYRGFLPPAGGVAVGDTVFGGEDFLFNTGNANGSIQWCDSAWLKGTVAMPVTDPVTTNNNHCETAYVLNLTTSVSELFGTKPYKNVNNLNVFPNPATENVSFNFDLKGQEGSLVVRDIAGRIVFQQELVKSFGERAISINVANFSNGMYVVELNTEESRNVGRILVQK